MKSQAGTSLTRQNEAASSSQLTFLAVSAMSVLAALLLATSAQAADHSAGQTGSPSGVELKQRYQRELAACQSTQPHQDMRSCQRDAASAFAAAKRGDLDDGAAAYARNAIERCMALPATQRQECTARMQGQGSIYGSVASGGILRELVVPEVTRKN